MNSDIIVSSISQGALWSIMAIGVFLTFRILDIADMTAEGSFPLGAVVSAQALVNGHSALVATIWGFLAGAAAGFVSGILHTKFKIPDLLTGILTMTGLYSINLWILDFKSNVSLTLDPKIKTLFTQFDLGNETTTTIVIGGGIALLVIILLVLFFNTEMGLAARAVGDNQAMSAANGINNDNMKIIVYMISNGLIALTGSLTAQANGFADVSSGIGTLVIALSAIIIAEIALRNLSFGMRLVTIIGGAIIYRWIIALVLDAGVNAQFLRLFYALMLVLFLALPTLRQQLKLIRRKRLNRQKVSGD